MSTPGAASCAVRRPEGTLLLAHAAAQAATHAAAPTAHTSLRDPRTSAPVKKHRAAARLCARPCAVWAVQPAARQERGGVEAQPRTCGCVPARG